MRKGIQATGLALALGLATGLAACGGTSGTDNSGVVDSSSSSTLIVPKACNGVVNVPGSADALQNALVNSLVPYLESLPRSASVVDIAASVSTLLDVVDTLSAATQSGSPANAVKTTTATLSCSLSYLAQSLTQLAGDGVSLTPAATALVNDLLNTVYATLGQLTGGGTPDFTAITTNLTKISTDLGSLLNTLVAGGSNSTPVITLGNSLQAALTDVTRALNAALAQDPSQLKAALAMTVQDLGSLVSSNTLSALGVRNDALSGLVDKLSTALNSTLNGLLHLLGLS